ncbi:MAG: zinc transport system ATP-binding protein [Methanolobus sp.]|jgi:zinc transport system ATP-binding protein|uniref:Cobalamin import ATP-binding protein BtuD n=1 Tax=Methanolobus tindarius DSM 2278 TaxID=1090322 RepID=W9DNE3_METTI|nr:MULTISPECIES: ABC transporter ATP-binding protein [Methanolobus]ETA67539.1 ATPase component of Mn/Zn ABC-type transporter [Methanolobus tindarius DSM 2278]MDI3486982.1 zinc transport system ATP-binding protein [Methanolobus sp.]MDK2832525.1 zinc transport system ATP-binding protein [Methanolobus sp.]MDK2939119.1 zinc transport system ATP-binding protein [Methanolobus sp.]
MENVIDLKDVWVSYDNVRVLESVNLTVKDKDFLAIIGPNGGGKSTLLKVILGLIKPDKGSVTLLGGRPAKTRKDVGYVPQYHSSNLDFPVTVWDVVLMGRLSHKGPLQRYNDEDRNAALEALKTVGMLDFKDRQIGELSGGQKQRVFIARSLVTKPKLLILDEPSTGIDSRMQKEFYELLNKLKSQIAIVMVTHDISAVSVYVDKIGCLNRKFHYHDDKEISPHDLEVSYQCPVELIAHGVPHRVLKEH